MRVAYVCLDPGVPVFGAKGASVHVQEVCHALASRGATVDLFATSIGGPRPGHLAGVRLHRLLEVPPMAPDRREHAVRELDAGLPDLLARHGPYDLVYERHALFGQAAMTAAAAAGWPGVLEVNAPLVDEQARYRGLVHRALAERALRRSLGAAGLVLAVSDPVARWVRRRAPHPQRVHVLPNGVDVHRVRPAPRAPAGPFTVGFVGTLKPWHGVEVLVAAVARLAAAGHPVRLLVVGDGPGRDHLTALVDRSRLGAATCFTGAVLPAEVPRLLNRMHAAAAPYPAAATYFSPLKVLEYLAAGLPVVASRVGQLPLLLGHGRYGLLVPPGDDRALADALARLAGDPQLCRELGGRARRAAVARHTWTARIDRVLALAGLPGGTGRSRGVA